MATLEERVACLEGQVSEHTQTLIDIRESIRQLEIGAAVRVARRHRGRASDALVM